MGVKTAKEIAAYLASNRQWRSIRRPGPMSGMQADVLYQLCHHVWPVDTVPVIGMTRMQGLMNAPQRILRRMHFQYLVLVRHGDRRVIAVLDMHRHAATQRHRR